MVTEKDFDTLNTSDQKEVLGADPPLLEDITQAVCELILREGEVLNAEPNNLTKEEILTRVQLIRNMRREFWAIEVSD